MTDYSDIINWENVFKESEKFKNQKPFHFGFVEEFFVRDFYEKLYETYPKIDDSWRTVSTHAKYQLSKTWGNLPSGDPAEDVDDNNFSTEWNKLQHYAHTEDFLENFRKFSGVPVNRVKFFVFLAYKKGGFQMPHIHNVGPSTLVLMVYFSKNWGQGDPGGTYMGTDVDESTIIFEPYNLDNTLAIFHDSPKAVHGTRYITKDVERRALQINLELFSPETGWSGKSDSAAMKKIMDNAIEL